MRFYIQDSGPDKGRLQEPPTRAIYESFSIKASLVRLLVKKR